MDSYEIRQKVQPLEAAKDWAALEALVNHPDFGPAARLVLKKRDSVYTLNLDSTQANVLVKALDLYSRMGMGQIEEVAHVLGQMHYGKVPYEKVHELEDALKKAKKDLFDCHPNASYGICGPKVPAEAKTAYDVECVLRQAVAKQEEAESWNVWHHDPLHTNREVPLARVSVKVETPFQKEHEALTKRVVEAADRQRIASTDQCDISIPEKDGDKYLVSVFNRLSETEWLYIFDPKTDTLTKKA
jgi:hypothetical protein